MMRLNAEFTTEPFVGEQDEPPAHALAARHAVEEAGLHCEFGPLGTSVSGTAKQVLAALSDAMNSAFAHGATRVTVRVEQVHADE
ncbi:MAG: thiamine-binding protein [Haloechinothrix sp.]